MDKVKWMLIPLWVLALSAVLAACAGVVQESSGEDQPPTGSESLGEDAIPPLPVLDATTTPENVLEGDAPDPFAGLSLRFNPAYWPDTDFTQHSVDYEEILSGGPPPDGIPSIDAPEFETVEDADRWIAEQWPVMLFEWKGEVRGYPLTILIYHEIVNDVVAGDPVVLTFCPLCNATIAFDRTLPDGTVLDFGTTGNLRNSDLVMYDRQTKSWWQQFTGEAIVGELTGMQLTFLPSQIVSWGEFKANHPDALVLARDTGANRPYGSNPYEGYDSIANANPFLFDGVPDGRLPAVERVVAVRIEGVDVAYPFSILSEQRVINDEITGTAMVIFWKEGTASTFGNLGQETGSTGTFSRVLDGVVLTFKYVEGAFEDEQTGSRWSLLGSAVEGPLAGSQLDRIISGEHFWFAWAAFRPETIIWTESGGVPAVP